MCLLASMMLDKEMIGKVVQIDRPRGVLPGRPPDHLRRAAQAVRAEPPDRRGHRSARSSAKRQLLEEVGGNAYLGADPQHRPLRRPRRALRRHRPREGAAAPAHRRQQRHPPRRLRPPRAGRARPRQGREEDLRHRPEEGRQRDGADGRRAARSLRDDREPRPAAASRPASSSSTT